MLGHFLYFALELQFGSNNQERIKIRDQMALRVTISVVMIFTFRLDNNISRRHYHTASDVPAVRILVGSHQWRQRRRGGRRRFVTPADAALRPQGGQRLGGRGLSIKKEGKGEEISHFLTRVSH